MSLLGDIFAGIRHVVTLDDRIARVERDVSRLQPEVSELGQRLTRVETILEMSMRRQPRLDRD